MGDGLCLKFRTPCGQNNPSVGLNKPLNLNLPLASEPKPTRQLSLGSSTKLQLDEKKWVKGTFWTLGAGTAAGGLALTLKTREGTFTRGLGAGLMTTGLASLTLDLLTEATSGKSMPRWARVTLSLGAGLLVGTLHPIFGSFDGSGIPGNPDRNPSDEYGP